MILMKKMTADAPFNVSYNTDTQRLMLEWLGEREFQGQKIKVKRAEGRQLTFERVEIFSAVPMSVYYAFPTGINAIPFVERRLRGKHACVLLREGIDYQN